MNEKKYFTLTDLNGKIVGMELGYMEDNRPSVRDRPPDIQNEDRRYR